MLSKHRHKLKNALVSRAAIQGRLHTMRSTGTYVTATTLGESVRAFVPHPLPPAKPALAPESCEAGTRAAELALARLSGVSGLVPSVEWLLYSPIRKEADPESTRLNSSHLVI